MHFRSILFCAFALVPTLAACGDDAGDGSGGGDSTTTGGSSTVTSTGTPTGTPSSSGAEGTGGDPSGGPGGGGPGSGGGSALSCDTYCDTIDEACTDEFAQYPGGGSAADRKASCMAQCAALPEGVYEDTGPSLGCHQYHADVALASPDPHCGHAGPTGDNTCGTLCENFCLQAVGVCPDVFISAAACEKVCPELSDTAAYSVNPPSEGDTLACRAYHLSVAAISADNAEVHCPHIAGDSDTCFD